MRRATRFATRNAQRLRAKPGTRPAFAQGMFPLRLVETPRVVADHAQAGPRYTSYPPATRFRPDFGSGDARAELAALPRGAPFSLYCHIPFCSQLCWYCGCNVTVTRNRGRGTEYVEQIAREIVLLRDALGERPVAEIALGGGSPNFLRTDDLVRLIATIYRHFELTDAPELGVELDPRDTRDEQIEALADIGFTRLSVGVQDFDPAVQETIHRIQSVEQTRHVIEHARRSGFSSVNADLVYGLPGQTPETFARTLDAVIAMQPDRIAAFGYAHLPHLRPHQKLIEARSPVPDLLTRATLLDGLLDRLASAGYVRVGLDHFALPDDPLVLAALNGTLHRNFQGYVPHRSDYLIGCGPSAISDSGGAYWQNEVSVDGWWKRIQTDELPVARGVRLSADDQLRRFVIMQLMCDGRIEFADVERRFGIVFDDALGHELACIEDAYGALASVDRRAGAIEATPLGHQLIRNLCRVFDRHTPEGAAGSPTI